MRRISTLWLLNLLCLGLLWIGIANTFTASRLGDKVIATAALPLRSAPPQDSYLVIKVEQVEVVREGEPVIIKDIQQVKGLFREDIWVKIKRERPKSGPHPDGYFSEPMGAAAISKKGTNPVISPNIAATL